jgi:Flp pilus assembly protein TadG
MNWLKKTKSESGQVAIIFALSIIPIFAVAGFALDFQNTIKKKQKVQLVVDSAVLAAARLKQTGAPDGEIETKVQQFIDAQILSMGGGFRCAAANTVVSSGDDVISTDILCSQETTLTRVIGQEKLDFRVESTAEYGIDKLDVAFMFDISGSMNSSSRITNLKAAAKEAIDVLLPPDAPAELIEDTRLAMVSYNTMVNAGAYFEQVAGVPATRTYTHEINTDGGGDATSDEGDTFDEITITLMNADRSRAVTELGDDAIAAIEDWSDNQTSDRMTIDVSIPGSSPLAGRVRSVRFDLSGTESRRQTENVVPYALYGDRRGRYNGRNWREGDYRLRVRLFDERRGRGRELFDERIDFEVVRGRDAGPETKEITLTSTCVWERDGTERFTDSTPGANAYLAHMTAWFEEDPSHRDGGVWVTGHPNRAGHSWYRGTECRGREPQGLTNDRDELNSYVNALTAGGGTAGHLGVAWSWYLISDNWDGIFTGDSAPLSFTEPDSEKVVILMTDGSFNSEVFPAQGSSDAQARALCDGMKSKNIKVYSVALNAPTAGKRVLEYCASGTDYFFEPETAAELTEAYRKIATSISDLRISE